MFLVRRQTPNAQQWNALPWGVHLDSNRCLGIDISNRPYQNTALRYSSIWSSKLLRESPYVALAKGNTPQVVWRRKLGSVEWKLSYGIYLKLILFIFGYLCKNRSQIMIQDRCPYQCVLRIYGVLYGTYQMKVRKGALLRNCRKSCRFGLQKCC